MKYLVTGGAGFIGSNIALYLDGLNYDVTVVDNFSTGHMENLKEFNGKIIKADVSKPYNFKDKYDAIFHQAAITDPRYPNDEEVLSQNVNGFSLMLKKAKKDKAKFIYASTASLYGNGSTPQKEDQPKELMNAYGTSKLIMDEMASHHFNDMHIVGLRYFNVFGPGEEGKGIPASMIYHLIKQMRGGKNPRIFKMGEQKRDHIYVKDCVSANIEALSAKSGIYNVGTGIGTSFNELVDILNEVLGTNLPVEYFDMPYDPLTYQSDTQADTKKAEEVLGFKSKFTLKNGIEEYFKLIKGTTTM